MVDGWTVQGLLTRNSTVINLNTKITKFSDCVGRKMMLPDVLVPTDGSDVIGSFGLDLTWRPFKWTDYRKFMPVTSQRGIRYEQ